MHTWQYHTLFPAHKPNPQNQQQVVRKPQNAKRRRLHATWWEPKQQTTLPSWTSAISAAATVSLDFVHAVVAKSVDGLQL
jgi:hypothetical protein